MDESMREPFKRLEKLQGVDAAHPMGRTRLVSFEEMKLQAELMKMFLEIEPTHQSVHRQPVEDTYVPFGFFGTVLRGTFLFLVLAVFLHLIF